jgi:tetratricopeptide (TPR) repeat protein
MAMKSLKRPLSLLLLAMLTACASSRSPMSLVSPTSSAAPVTASGAVPRVDLTPELLFGVLASEIASQRGASSSAALTDLTLARQVRDPRLAERAAQFALVAGNQTVSRDALALWLQLDPESIPARRQLMVFSLYSASPAVCQPVIEDLLQRDPANAAMVFDSIARLITRQKDKAGAYRMVQALVRNYPSLPEARFALITAASAAGDESLARGEFDRLASLAPKWDLPVAWEAERLRKKNPEAALAFLQKELARRPAASLELKMAYPRLLVGTRRFVEARQEFEALLVNNPRQPDLLYSAGLLAFQLNDLPTARTELEGALVGRYPDADFLRYSLGQISEGLKDAEAARHWYAQVGPGVQYLPAQVRLAFLDAQNGQVDAGLGRLAKLGSNDAERVQLVLIQSEMAREAKRYARADALLTKALRRYPRTPELLYERSLARDLLNQTAAAERDLRSLLKIRPRDEQALNALGYILANRTTRYDEAYGLISRALKLAPDNPMIIDSMGWVLYRQGHPDQALPYLTRAYAVLPDQEVAAHYGEVLWKLGRQQEARELWAKAAALPGEHPELDETMKRLIPR